MPSGNFFSFFTCITCMETFVIPAHQTQPRDEFYQEPTQAFLTVKLQTLGVSLASWSWTWRMPCLVFKPPVLFYLRCPFVQNSMKGQQWVLTPGHWLCCEYLPLPTSVLSLCRWPCKHLPLLETVSCLFSLCHQKADLRQDCSRGIGRCFLNPLFSRDLVRRVRFFLF